MNQKLKRRVLALGAALSLCLSACAEADPVPVTRADLLTQAAVANDYFSGMVVSENVVQISRESEYTIDELFVSVGDQVRASEKLFSYDIDKLNLTIDKQKLEMDKLNKDIKDYNTQIKQLESDIKKEKDSNTKATMELNLSNTKLNLSQAEYDKKTLQAEIDYNQKIAKNALVRSPIAGTVRAIDEAGDPYITIQQTGAYQVKGNLNELSLNAGITEGVSVTVCSRVNPNQTWAGFVSLVDYGGGETNDYGGMIGGDGMNTSTSYPFYITLESTDGLLLGQHVYIRINAATNDGLLRIPESYILDAAYDETTGIISGCVWAADAEGKLALVPVVLGEFDPTTGSYVVTDGLSPDSFVADPAHPGCEEGAAVSYRDEDVYAGTEEPEHIPSDPTGTAPLEGETAGSESSESVPAVTGSAAPDEPAEPGMEG